MTDDHIQRRLNWIDGDQRHQGEEADILGQQRPVVILGEPGMGNTELLKRLGSQPHGNGSDDLTLRLGHRSSDCPNSNSTSGRSSDGPMTYT